MDSPSTRLDAKHLYRRLDALFGRLDKRKPQRKILESFLEDAFGAFRDALRLRAGALYRERRDDFELQKLVGDPGGRVADNLDPLRPPLTAIFQHRVYIFDDPLSETSPHRQGLFPMAGVAGLVVGTRPNRSVMLFVLDDGWQREELDFTLNTVRSALGSRLWDERVRGSVKEAAQIQRSLLVEDPPAFAGYDIACRSVNADEVGGDFYDFMPYGEEMLGISIGDASGHGLPAALVVRDVVTGLRMGLARELKVSHVFETLNRVIHRSNLSSRFVSVFYGELEQDGNLIYVNAGHQPPVVFGPHGQRTLDIGGTVIGPLPEARFRRGITHIAPGEVIVMCTDGILERRGPKGEFFGEERVAGLVRDSLDLSADALLDRVFRATATWGTPRPWEDDATMVVVKRLPKP